MIGYWSDQEEPTAILQQFAPMMMREYKCDDFRSTKECVTELQKKKGKPSWLQTSMKKSAIAEV